jgi:hypothetical protein
MMNSTSNRIGSEPRPSAVLRTIRVLVGCYAALSALTLVAAFLMGDDPVLVPDSVWVRGIIVLISSLLLNAFAARAARGSRGAWRRVWLFSAVMTVAIVVIIAIPGVFPVWMKIEQGVCGALLVAVVALARGRVLRAAFAAPTARAGS